MKQGARALDVCISDDTISYAYGPPGEPPELALSDPVAKVLHQPWPGVSRSIWESTTFENEGYAYEVFISVDRMEENHPTHSGVNVLKGGELVAEVACDPGSDQIGLWAVSDAKEAAGVCWNHETFSWDNCK